MAYNVGSHINITSPQPVDLMQALLPNFMAERVIVISEIFLPSLPCL
jgi:hypothetical protein